MWLISKEGSPDCWIPKESILTFGKQNFYIYVEGGTMAHLCMRIIDTAQPSKTVVFCYPEYNTEDAHVFFEVLKVSHKENKDLTLPEFLTAYVLPYDNSHK